MIGAARISRILILAALVAFPSAQYAAQPAAGAPRIAIIIDDIGYRPGPDMEALALPGPLAYAVLPHSPHTERVSRLAAERGKEVLLHLPMQAIENEKNRFLGPGGLTVEMSHAEFVRTLDFDLQSVPAAIGVNNHMGSLLTRHAGRMAWLMDALRSRNKFYVDSMTSRDSVAATMARRMNVPVLRRDVFLDDSRQTADVAARFAALVQTAKRRGSALAIGHPYPGTLEVLARELQRLDAHGVRLVSLRGLIDAAPVDATVTLNP